MFSLVRYYPSYWNNICFRSVFHLHQLLNVASVWCNSFFVVQQGLTIFHFSFSIYGLRFFYSSLISSSWYLFNYNALFSLNGWSFFRKKGNYKQGNHVLQIQKFPNNIHHGNASWAGQAVEPFHITPKHLNEKALLPLRSSSEWFILLNILIHLL